MPSLSGKGVCDLVFYPSVVPAVGDVMGPRRRTGLQVGWTRVGLAGIEHDELQSEMAAHAVTYRCGTTRLPTPPEMIEESLSTTMAFSSCP